MAHPNEELARKASEALSKGDIQALRPPPVISGFEQPMGAVPGLGEHTDAVLRELGLTADEISRLRVDGVIGAAYS